MKFVRVGNGDDGDTLIALSQVIAIERHYRAERGDIVVYRGTDNHFEYAEVYARDGSGSFSSAIVEL